MPLVIWGQGVGIWFILPRKNSWYIFLYIYIHIHSEYIFLKWYHHILFISTIFLSFAILQFQRARKDPELASCMGWCTWSSNMWFYQVWFIFSRPPWKIDEKSKFWHRKLSCFFSQSRPSQSALLKVVKLHHYVSFPLCVQCSCIRTRFLDFFNLRIKWHFSQQNVFGAQQQSHRGRTIEHILELEVLFWNYRKGRMFSLHGRLLKQPQQNKTNKQTGRLKRSRIFLQYN